MRGGYGRGFGFRNGSGIWTEGNSIGTQDSPRADRHFVLVLRRLTRIHVRSVEQPISLDDSGEFDWPWLYAVQAGRWQLTDNQAKGLRDYLLRGGFFMADDFCLDDRYQVASQGSVRAGRSWKCDPCPDRWRGIFDDHGRLMVAITFHSDVGDSWEWADAPSYPERYAARGIRIGVNYVVYAMTH